MKWKAIIVDDEQHARTLFRQVLDMLDHSVEIVGEAEDLPGAFRLISSQQPDIVFMDINMPGYSGLQIQDFFQEDRPFKLIYVTAHPDYVIDALRGQAFDYLTKPLEISELDRCLKRLDTLTSSKEDMPEQGGNSRKLKVQSHQGTLYINLSDITMIEASSMYSVVHTTKEQIIVSKPLKEFEFLEKNRFFRVHRSYIINTEKVSKINSVNTLEAVLSDGQKIPVSRTRKEHFIDYMHRTYGVGKL